MWYFGIHTLTPTHHQRTYSSLPNMSLCPLVIPPSCEPSTDPVHRQPLICFLSLHSFAFSWNVMQNLAVCTFFFWFHTPVIILRFILLCVLTTFLSLLGSIPLFGFYINPTWMGRLKFRKVKWLAQGHLAGNWWTWIQVVALQGQRTELPPVCSLLLDYDAFFLW